MSTHSSARHRAAVRARGRTAAAWLAVGSSAAVVVVLGAVPAKRDTLPDAAAAVHTRTETSTLARETAESRWRRVLAALAVTRGRAWQTGEPGLLRRVYVAASPVLRADRRMLAAYRLRGLRPQGVRLEFTSVFVVRRQPGEVTLAAVDRLNPTRVRSSLGTVVSLPADQPTAHTIVLRRVGGRWLIADVRTRDPDPDRTARSFPVSRAPRPADR
jgi:hypothetical protein